MLNVLKVSCRWKKLLARFLTNVVMQLQNQRMKEMLFGRDPQRSTTPASSSNKDYCQSEVKSAMALHSWVFKTFWGRYSTNTLVVPLPTALLMKELFLMSILNFCVSRSNGEWTSAQVSSITHSHIPDGYILKKVMIFLNNGLYIQTSLWKLSLAHSNSQATCGYHSGKY